MYTEAGTARAARETAPASAPRPTARRQPNGSRATPRAGPGPPSPVATQAARRTGRSTRYASTRCSPRRCPAPRRPGLIPTDIADTIGPVLGKAIADIKAHEDGSRRGGDIEDVHKMRVATRRVRAYLKAARPALDRVATDRLRADVRELAGTLGVIRDNDVMIHRLHIEAGLLGDPDTGALEHLITRLDTERIAGRDRLISELDDPSYQALLTELEEAARCSRRWPTPGPICTSWPPTSGGCWTRPTANCTGRSARTHRTTSCTNCGSTASVPATRPNCCTTRALSASFLEALAAFQEVLGNHQDACVLEDKLRELVEESGDPARRDRRRPGDPGLPRTAGRRHGRPTRRPGKRRKRPAARPLPADHW